MRTFLVNLVSFTAAALVPAALLISWDILATFAVTDATSDPYAWVRIRNLAIPTLLVSSAHVLFLGVPAFFLLRRFSAISWYSSTATGFLLGCLPIGVLTWPLRYALPGASSSHWSGGEMVATMVDGVPTLAGWLSWVFGMGFMGIFGAIGGLAFWLMWRRGLRPNNSFKPKPLRGSA